MLENRFMELVKDCVNGKVSEKEVMYKINKVVDAVVKEIYDKKEIKISDDELALFAKMFDVARILDPQNMELHANLYALVATALQMKSAE